MTAAAPRIARVRMAIEGAASLATKVSPIWRDQRDIAQGWLIHYAVDTDIVGLALNPTLAQMSSYASIFEGFPEVKKTQNVLARRLGEYIFREFDPQHTASSLIEGNAKRTALPLPPLLIFSPHSEELDVMLLALARKVKERHRKVDSELLSFATDLRHHKTVKDLEEALILRAPLTVELLSGGTGAMAELSRYAHIVRGRLLNTERYAGPGGAFPRVPNDNLVERSQYSEFMDLLGGWRDRLTATAPPAKKESSIARDSHVMASLEYINRRLSTQQRRLVLLSGAPYLLQASEKYTNRGRSFTYHHVREPLAVAGCNNFFRTAKTTDRRAEFRLIEWLNLFFPSALQRDNRHGVIKLAPDQLESSLRAILHDPGLQEVADGPFGDLILEWCEQVESVGVLNELADAANAGRLRKILESLSRDVNSQDNDARTPHDNEYWIHNLSTLVQNRVSHSLRQLYVDTGWVGVMQLGHDEPYAHRFRGLPALRFDKHFSIAQEECNALFDILVDPDNKPRQIDLSALYSKLRGIDEIDYHAMLIHGLVYAANGHWQATKTLALVALDAARSLPPNERNGRLGREAAYLQAIAVRRLARSAEDLQEAEELLKLARSSDYPDAGDDPRFASEDLARWVAAIQFHLFDHRVEANAQQAKSMLLRDFGEKWTLAHKLATVDAMSFATQKGDHPVQRWLQRQSGTNGLLLAILLAIVDEHTAIKYQAQVMDLAQKLFEWHLTPPVGAKAMPAPIYRDVISDFIYAVALTIFSGDPKLRRDAFTLACEIQPSVLTPLDNIRFPAFRAFAEKHTR